MGEQRREDDKKIDQMERKIDKIYVAILGDMETEKDGLLTRVKLVEISTSRLWKLGIAIIMCVIGAYIK